MPMRLRSGRLTQDQKFSVHFDEVKTNGSTVEKNKGGLRGRKAVNDISNSKNVIPIGEDDLGVSKKVAQIPKAQSGKKAQVSGRKALDGVKTNTVEKKKGGLSGRKALTNSVKPQQGLKKKVEKKSSIVVAEDEDEKLSFAIDEELRFQHNHEECIKSQNTSMYLRRLAYINEINEGKPRYLSAELALQLESEAQLKSISEDDMLFEIPEPGGVAKVYNERSRKSRYRCREEI